eukprot:1390214-Amorphochlora_amoeboformis.AAC.1
MSEFREFDGEKPAENKGLPSERNRTPWCHIPRGVQNVVGANHGADMDGRVPRKMQVRFSAVGSQKAKN